MRKTFTDKFVRHAKPVADRQTDYWDQSLNGFGLRVSPKGKKTFQIYYRHHRHQRRLSCTNVPEIATCVPTGGIVV